MEGVFLKYKTKNKYYSHEIKLKDVTHYINFE